MEKGKKGLEGGKERKKFQGNEGMKEGGSDGGGRSGREGGSEGRWERWRDGTRVEGSEEEEGRRRVE